MAKGTIRQEDVAGLTLAIAAHAALAAWILFGPKAPAPAPVEKVTVTLDGIVAPEARSPSREQARVATAPELAPEPAPPAPAPVPSPVPAPLVKAPPPPLPRPIPTPAPRTQAAPPRTQPRPAPPQPQRQQVGSDFLKGVASPSPKKAGGGRIGPNFLPGAASGSATGKAPTPPGPALTPQVRASLAGEVARQLKSHWQQPDGVDVEKLATTIEWDLNPDGSLAGAPRFVNQTGVNSVNRAQAERHKEQAIRAVRLSAPFRLPPQFYSGWQHLRFTFDWKLNQ